MITRANLAEQLRDYQLRSQQNWASLSFFSSTANISTRGDAAWAGLMGLLFLLLLIVTFTAFHLRYNKIAACFLLMAMLLLISLKIIRHKRLAKRRQRRMLLPLSM
ncbi:hypothetical protein GOP47_0021072 [Adiantum capillus-veneris]|uniref:Uncharacterized protein n=1 Tax=Adiantum capillus-veneris TaxID=13818 RepID=A0A9D4Z8B5_ADICA|nr:hypothetical protein GOP47_0021072 [Adiantum capillus-veneris]